MAYIANLQRTPGALQVPTPAVETQAQPPPAAKKPSDEELLQHLTVLAYGDPDSGDAPLKVKFTVDLSEVDEVKDPKFSWDFDDDSPKSSAREPEHVYKKPGKYKARVKVKDANGKAGDDTVVVDVSVPDPPSNKPAQGAPAQKQEAAEKP